ncbi:hypothetical protein ACMU_16225 [Actibacterium mucosum KCTC 23349]|uniref:Uncharacterized protein n=1 Tax=Actibacterium mucosum KCTC 23349 TaxID=1454373 RepID=A0A037ZGJ4_9RHOB|nr:hypothetical protein [Actibacterium mucosum]KAJ54661.1 hypothetical protein ACMU_16225 [Actibacterium mucosum KCTC 23349]
MFFKFDVEADTRDWVFDQFEWAIAEGILSAQTPLILPNASFFPSGSGTPDETVLGLVRSIQDHLKIPDAVIHVAQADVLPAEYRHNYQDLASVAGTWQGDDEGGAMIRYDPALMNAKIGFLSILVHEVLHHRLNNAETPLDMDPAEEELATDLHCITSGFGVISMSGAEQLGWQGYMRQETRAFCLALFCQITGTQDVALAEIAPRSRKLLKRALKYCASFSDDLNALKAAASGAPAH